MERIDLEDGHLVWIKSWIPNEKANLLYKSLLLTLPWSSYSIQLFGKDVEIPRKESFHAVHPNLAYGYSGKRLVTHLFTAELEALLAQLNAQFHLDLNSVLANLYQCGQDSNGWHADNEKELGENPVIVSVSLGQTRSFKLKHRRHGTVHTLNLANGDLLLMSDTIQKHYVHQVPKTKKNVLGRINLTFRKIVS